MTVVYHPPSFDASTRTTARLKLDVLVWLSSFVLMLWTIPFAPVQRAQEARVLVTAREMLDRSDAGEGWRAWMIPHANGEVRLQKPPLAYWMAAASFTMFGIHDWAGRLPFALCGWLTIVLTYYIARFAFESSPLVALWSAALLAGSFLFHRHARLAETDVVVTLALTFAIFAIWRGVALIDRPHHQLWFALSGVAIGIGIIAKGLPAFCAILFLIAMILATRNWRIALKWIINGAPIFITLIGAPWWIFVQTLPQSGLVRHELKVLMDEPNHPGWFVVYIPYLLKAMLPWSPLVVAGLIDAALNWRRDVRIRATLTPLLIWCGAVLIPLCFLGNKQQHYLLPMMPPLALIAAWWLDRVVNLDSVPTTKTIARWIIGITGAVIMLGALGLPMLARELRGHIASVDWIVAGILLLTTVFVLHEMKRSLVAGCMAFSLSCAAFVSLTQGYWWSTTEVPSPRTVAAEIRSLGSGSYCFDKNSVSLPLAYYLRVVVPQADNPDELTQLIAARTDTLVIAQSKIGCAQSPDPPGCELTREIGMKEYKFRIYRAVPDAPRDHSAASRSAAIAARMPSNRSGPASRSMTSGPK